METGRPQPRVVCFATQGTGHREEERIRTLLRDLGPEVWPFDRSGKAATARDLVRRGARERPDLVVMEGTGIAGGLAVMALRRRHGIPYVVSSGDAVGPFLAARRPAAGPAARRYERALYGRSAGFIGWTPYFAGRALELGAPRATWAANFAPGSPAPGDRERVREALGIAAGDVVFGIAGTLDWNDRVGYCYGAELVRALRRTERPDAKVLVVGDGSGTEHLRRLAAGDPRVLLPGRVPRDEVQAHLAAMDVGSLPQSVDLVGALRYTTKLSEYVAAGLPLVTGEIPLAYEFDDGWVVRLPGDAPWDERYVAALADRMAGLSRGQADALRSAVPVGHPVFDADRQARQVGGFVRDVLAREAGVARGTTR